jgi:hypothetical protein
MRRKKMDSVSSVLLPEEKEKSNPIQLTLQLLISLSPTRKRTQPRNKLLKINRSSTVLIKNSNHPTRERVRGDLRDLEELVSVDRTGTVFVELHEALF